MNLIDKEHLFKPVKEIWENIEYKDLNIINNLNLKLNENKLLNNYDISLNHGMFHSINYYQNIEILNIFGLSKKDAYLYYINNLKNKYKIYGIKSFKFCKNILIKIFYQLLFFRQKFNSYHELITYINNNIKFISNIDNNDINVNILILIKNNENSILSEENDNNKYIYCPNDNKEKIISSSIFFHESSINIIEKQNLENFIKFNNTNFIELVNKIHETFDSINQNKILLFSSIVLEILGLRKANDIDIYIHSLNDENLDKATKFYDLTYADVSIKNTDSWPIHWNKWLDEWARESKAKYFEEVLGNQNFHFYFLGIKIIGLNCDIVRRVFRERPAAFCDLIMLNKNLNLNIKLPSIPKNSVQYIKLEDVSESEINNMRQKYEYNTENREFVIKKKIDNDKFLNTIKNYCFHRYDYQISINELKSLLLKKKFKIKIKKT